MRKPLESTGWVIQKSVSGKLRFVGTCFGFRRKAVFLTAAHCIHEYVAGSLSICMYGERMDGGRAVEEVIVHPCADVAILKLADFRSRFDLFSGETSIYTWGVSVSAFGYPEGTGQTGVEFTPRFFRGNIQRMFNHVSPFGYTYEAAELSFCAPAGLSGGPVSPDSDYSMVMGVVAENLTSTTNLSTITEEITATNTRTERIWDRVSYAIAVRLDPLSKWFDEHIPFPSVGC